MAIGGILWSNGVDLTTETNAMWYLTTDISRERLAKLFTELNSFIYFRFNRISAFFAEYLHYILFFVYYHLGGQRLPSSLAPLQACLR